MDDWSAYQVIIRPLEVEMSQDLNFHRWEAAAEKARIIAENCKKIQIYCLNKELYGR